MPTPRHGTGEYLKTLREVAFAQGLCYECTARPVLFGKRRCEECLKRHRTRLDAKFAAGQCTGLCGRRREPGFTRCASCRERHRQYMEARRRAAGAKPFVPRAPGAKRVRTSRVRKVSSTSVVPSACPHPAPTDGPRMAESAPPAEVDLSTRRAVIAALVARRAA